MQGSFVATIFRKKKQQQKRQTNFRATKLRYVAIVLACLVVFGCEYCFDTPSALQTDIKQNYKRQTDEELGQAQFNLLYSLYSFPNVVVPLIGGMLIDKIGARLVMLIVGVICVLGHLVFSFGGLQNVFTLMLVGRVIFGVGGEVLHASQNTLISNWFKASELSMAIGICISFPKLGSSLNAVLSPKVGKTFKEQDPQSYLNVGAPLFLGLIFMGVSLGLAFILAYIDRKTQKKQKYLHESALLSRQNIDPPAHQSSNIRKSSYSKGVQSVQIAITSQISKHGVQHTGNQHLNFAAIKQLPVTFWILMLIAMLSEALFIPFLDNGNEYYQKVFKGINDPQEAGIYLILPYVVSSVLVPVMGYSVDKIGRRSIVLIFSMGFILFTYIVMMAIETSVTLRSYEWVRWVPTGLLGICIAIFCTVVVPTVPMLVKPKLLGTGLGIMEMVQNLALALFPIIAGLIRQTQHENQLKGFHLQTLFFFIVACLCFSASIWLKTADLLTGNFLDVKNFRKQYVNKVLRQDDD